ncbi:MAG: hypothetical protein K5873_07670 [Treponema sp.]|nr:hypothetical protein [Treponema sp.]
MFLFSENYIVEKVVGNVTFKENGGWSSVREGQELTGGTQINTALNSLLIVSDGSSTSKIRSMQKGSVEELALSSVNRAGLVNTSLSRLNIAGQALAGKDDFSGGISRASEAKSDLEWEE